MKRPNFRVADVEICVFCKHVSQDWDTLEHTCTKYKVLVNAWCVCDDFDKEIEQ